jgi:outer membrane protein assembly factor BamB
MNWFAARAVPVTATGGRFDFARRSLSYRVVGAFLMALAAVAAQAEDWPHWRGPQRNGISSETGVSAVLLSGKPRRLWAVQIGEGFSAPAVAGGRLFVSGNKGGQDTLWCLNPETSRMIWRYDYPSQGGEYGGPRASPAVEGGRVYSFSRQGVAFCVDAASGKLVWSREVARELRADAPRWGFSGSPLVWGRLLILNVGNSGVALNRASGQVVWNSGGSGSAYASPVPYSIAGQRGVLLFSAAGLFAVNPQDGRVLWQHPWNTSYNVNAADPVIVGDTIFISSNYQKGCALLKVVRGRPQLLWESKNMRNHFNSSVAVGGALFGNDEGALKCIDMQTGAERWRTGGFGKGGLLVAEGKIVGLSERGELWVYSAAADDRKQLARVPVMRGTCWTQPVLANGRLYCRNHEGELVCLALK